MIASSLVHAARRAPDARCHVFRMAKVMAERKSGPEGACTVVHLFQAGFTEAQVVAYRDPARALLQGLELGLTTSPPGRREAEAAVEAIRDLRVMRLGERMFGAAARRPADPAPPAAPEPLVWSMPVVRELNNLELTL